jgi:hypothetical protein
MLGKRPRVYLSRVPTDMRCSLEGLSARVRATIDEDPLSGHLFVYLGVVLGSCAEEVFLDIGGRASCA